MKNEKGFILIVTMFMLIVMASLTVYSIHTAYIEGIISRRYVENKVDFYTAESSAEYCVSRILNETDTETLLGLKPNGFITAKGHLPTEITVGKYRFMAKVMKTDLNIDNPEVYYMCVGIGNDKRIEIGVKRRLKGNKVISYD